MCFQPRGMRGVTGIMVGFGMLMLTSCSGKEPKPMAQPTPDQVRGHADRGFDNLKKDEQDRGSSRLTTP